MVALRYAARTNVGLGSKSRNEDSAYAGPELLVLCDGMGGHAAGDVASSLVVSELVHLDGESHGADDSLDILARAVEEANSRLADVMEVYPDSDGMGTTCIAMMRTGTKLAVANIGDSRAYLLRDGRLTRITKDHSFVQKLLDEGRITKDEAQHHPQRSLVTRVLTGRPEDTPDPSLRELRVGDRLLLCSDGLTDYVAEDTVAELLDPGDRTPGEAADELVQVALRAATRDNVTVIVAELVHAREGTTKPQVVGAASERRRAQTIGRLTPAEKAAQLSREASGTTLAEPPVLAEEGPTHPVVRWLRRFLVAAALVAVLGAGAWGAWSWSQQQYFVGEQDGLVTIYRGVSQDLGPVSLSTPEDQTDLPVEALPAFYQDQVRRTLSADDRGGADSIVEELRRLAALECEPVVVLPDGTRTTEVPEGAVAVTIGTEEAARVALPTPTGADGTAATSAPATSARDVAGLGPLEAGVGLGAGEASDDASASATDAEARPTVQVIYPEGCP